MITEGSTAEAGTSVSATGVIAIVALTAISKIELQVENIEGQVYTDAKWLEFILGQIIANAIKI